MNYTELLAYINLWIKTNGNREITADVLNPVLKAIAEWALSQVGDLSTLNTTDKSNLTNAINEVNQALANVDINGSQVYSGLDNPNTTPPPSYSAADFYVQLDAFNTVVALFLYDGNIWQNLTSILVQNNIPLKAEILSSDLSTNDIAGFVTYFNALDPNLTISAVNSIVQFLLTDTNEVYQLTGVGSGIYGDGATQITDDNVLFFGTGGGTLQGIQSVLSQTNKVYTETIGDYTYELSAFIDESGTKMFRIKITNNVTGFNSVQEISSESISQSVDDGSGNVISQIFDTSDGLRAVVQNTTGQNTSKTPFKTAAGDSVISQRADLPTGNYDLAIDTKVISSNYTAVNGEPITTIDTCVITDIPSPELGYFYTVLVQRANTDVGGVTYTKGSFVIRWYDETGWNSINLIGGSSIDLNAPFVTITDLGGTIFTDLATAHTWIGTYTDNSLLTNEVFSNGVYRFTCPINTSIGLDFCSATSGSQDLRIIDGWGLIGSYGDSAFVQNTQNNEFCIYANLSLETIFGSDSWSNSTGNNILNGINTFGEGCFITAIPSIKNTINTLKDCGVQFALGYTGRFDVNKFGIDGIINLPTDIFTSSNIALLITDYSNRFNNSDDIDADLVNAMINLKAGNPLSFVSFDGAPFVIENSTTVALTTSDLDTAYPYAMADTKVICASIIGGGFTYTRAKTQWTATAIITP